MTNSFFDIRSIRGAIVALVVAMLALFAFQALAAAPASAQGQPAICEEYPNLPQCEDDGGGGGDDEDPTGGGGGDEGDDFGAGASGDSSGNLPFTGYPLSTLFLVLFALLAAGLTLRAYVAIRERLGARASGGPRLP